MNKMEKEFNVPYYIVEEIMEYVWLVAKGKSKIIQEDKIDNLLQLAVGSERMTKEQAEILRISIKKYF